MANGGGQVQVGPIVNMNMPGGMHGYQQVIVANIPGGNMGQNNG